MTISKLYQMDPSLEIRKLSPKHVRDLVEILETHELWKRLMSIIPKKLERDSYVCDITLDNQHKYHSEHFKKIEYASEHFKRACTEILLDEWGTSGRIRPTIGHLLYLLTKAKLYRAADYVAETLLHQPKPERPSGGPEALITIPEPSKFRDNHKEEIERILDDINYPSSAMLIITSNSDEVTRRSNSPNIIPQIIISPDIEEDRQQAPDFTLPLVIQRERTSEGAESETVSDMIKFSTGSISTRSQNLSESDNRPEISQLLESGENLPNFELMNGSVNVSSVDSSKELSLDTSESIEASPAFSQLLDDETSQSNNVPAYIMGTQDELELQEPNIPNLSVLNHPVSDDIPNLSILNFQQEDSLSSREEISNIMPDFDALNSRTNISKEPLGAHKSTLLPNSSILNPSRTLSVNISTHLLPTSVNSSQNSSENSTKSRPCTSPLPNLSLNTLLPHFNYSELQLATNNFNEYPFEGKENSGRLLGKGAFGSVFLAFGLLDRPVAVKKLILEDVEVVNIDDTVTKQFRNEVEVLSKYKHENLLSLLGYSCDGCTYCLMYEFIPGGALKDRLQVSENKLQWKERINIAMGTAEAVAYLHTAFSTPLIHRDIKSANILLDSTNKPKLGDFGLIKLSPSQNTNTATSVFGTSAYMAPEAFRGDVSVKLDTFSFGVVLLELLTSLPPMDESREGTDLVTHVEEVCESKDIAPLLDKETGDWWEHNKNFAEELYKIALKCLEEKKKRPNMVEATALLKQLYDELFGR